MKGMIGKMFIVLGLLAPVMVSVADVSSSAVMDGEVLSSNLPLVLITTEGNINADSKVAGWMKIIDHGEGKRNVVTDTLFNYNGRIGIKWRGNSSLSFEQKKYTLETQDAEGNDQKASLLGMPQESDWVLLAPYNDISLVRDCFAFSMWNEMGHWGPRTRMCEVTVNGEYMGVYVLSEQIKRDKNRVDIAKLKEDDLEGRELTGGYIVRVDAFDDGDATFTSKVRGIQPGMWAGGNNSGTVTWTVYYPKKKNLKQEQMDYISEFVGQVEQSFQQPDAADPATGYAQWINVPSFVDYFIHTELSLNADGYKRSSYFFKDKDGKDGQRGKLEAGPVWDYNLAYGNCNFCNANNVTAWVYQGCYTNPTPAFWSRLAADKQFMTQVKQRYAQLRRTILSQEYINDFFDTYADLLNEAQQRHYKKYSNLLTSGNQGGGWPWWPWGGGQMNPAAAFAAYFVESYEEEITTVKNWFGQRLAFLDREWGYEASTKVEAPRGYFDMEVDVAANGRRLRLSASRRLCSVDVFSVSGRQLLHRDVDVASDTSCTLPMPTSLPNVVVVGCTATDGSYISRICRLKR